MVANLLHRTQEVHGDQILYRFSNGLVVKTERLGAKTPLRILGLGSPQNTLLNYMLNSFEVLRNRTFSNPLPGRGYWA
jgi:hypothetical protein